MPLINSSVTIGSNNIVRFHHEPIIPDKRVIDSAQGAKDGVSTSLFNDQHQFDSMSHRHKEETKNTKQTIAGSIMANSKRMAMGLLDMSRDKSLPWLIVDCEGRWYSNEGCW